MSALAALTARTLNETPGSSEIGREPKAENRLQPRQTLTVDGQRLTGDGKPLPSGALMPDPISALRWYETNAHLVAERYESHDPEIVHRWWRDQLPATPAAILDIGAGTGRDAAWLAELGHDVIAVEPARAMMQEGLRRRPNPRFRWIEDQLPGLDRVSRLGIAYDLILFSAVWMFLPPADRSRAFRKTVQLLKPGGRIVITFRPPPKPPAELRGMYPVSVSEFEKLARAHAVSITSCTTEDLPEPDGVIHWTRLVLRLPDAAAETKT
jgi:SAM-dependent methyltransferase